MTRQLLIILLLFVFSESAGCTWDARAAADEKTNPHVEKARDPKLGKEFEYLRIINLTDETYAERVDYTSFTGDRYFPGKPRNAMLSASYTW